MFLSSGTSFLGQEIIEEYEDWESIIRGTERYVGNGLFEKI